MDVYPINSPSVSRIQSGASMNCPKRAFGKRWANLLRSVIGIIPLRFDFFQFIYRPEQLAGGLQWASLAQLAPVPLPVVGDCCFYVLHGVASNKVPCSDFELIAPVAHSNMYKPVSGCTQLRSFCRLPFRSIPDKSNPVIFCSSGI